jgi:hypothetical protein
VTNWNLDNPFFNHLLDYYFLNGLDDFHRPVNRVIDNDGYLFLDLNNLWHLHEIVNGLFQFNILHNFNGHLLHHSHLFDVSHFTKYFYQPFLVAWYFDNLLFHNHCLHGNRLFTVHGDFNCTFFPDHLFHFLDFDLFDGDFLQHFELHSSFVEDYSLDHLLLGDGHLHGLLFGKENSLLMHSNVSSSLLNYDSNLVLDNNWLLNHSLHHLRRFCVESVTLREYSKVSTEILFDNLLNFQDLWH